MTKPGLHYQASYEEFEYKDLVNMVQCKLFQMSTMVGEAIEI
jgi:hypothetical protein